MPALFAAGMVPGVLAGIALIVPAVWMARKHKMGALKSPPCPRPPFWKSLREASQPGRAGADSGRHARGWFTPTEEAAVVAVFYGLFVGMVVAAPFPCATCFPSCANRASCRR